MDLYAASFKRPLDAGFFRDLLPLVEKDKKERILRYRRWEDQHRVLFADLLLRSVVVEKTGLRNKDLSFQQNSFQKPLFPGNSSFHFNLSHSGNWVLCAIDNMPIGVDIEEVREIGMDVIDVCLTQEEKGEITGKNNSTRLEHFFTLWTLKESYTKALGKGLFLPLDSFSVRGLLNGRYYLVYRGKIQKDVFFKTYCIDKGYKTAVCSFHDEFPDEIIHKDLIDIRALLGRG